MTPSTELKFKHYYTQHCQYLKLKGLQPKTIDAYSRAIRRIGEYFQREFGSFNSGSVGGLFS